MTKSEFLYNFYITYDKVASQDAPGYTSEEVAVFANQAQIELLLTYYDSKERQLVGTFEASEKVKVYLDTLVMEDTVTTLVNTPNNYNSTSYYIQLDQEYLFLISEHAWDNEGNKVTIKPVTHDYLEANLENPYKAPRKWIGENMAFRLNKSGKIELVSTDTVLSKYHYMYIKYPEKINLIDTLNNSVSEFDDILHEELLKTTVRLASVATDTELYQIRNIEGESNK